MVFYNNIANVFAELLCAFENRLFALIVIIQIVNIRPVEGMHFEGFLQNIKQVFSSNGSFVRVNRLSAVIIQSVSGNAHLSTAVSIYSIIS